MGSFDYEMTRITFENVVFLVENGRFFQKKSYNIHFLEISSIFFVQLFSRKMSANLPKCPRNKFFLSACSLLKKLNVFLFFKINKNNYKNFSIQNCLTNIRHIFKEYQMLFRVERGSVGDGRFSDSQWDSIETDFSREAATRGVKEPFQG